MYYLANQRMKRADGGYHEVGDVVPEAATWPWTITETYVRNSRLLRVVDASPAPVPVPALARKETTHGR